MTTGSLARAEERMQQQWYNLVMAEQQGAPPATLERLYQAYILAAEEYNLCSTTSDATPVTEQAEKMPVPVKSPRRPSPVPPSKSSQHRKKAS